MYVCAVLLCYACVLMCACHDLQVRVMLLCGADVLASMAAPGVWQHPDQILSQYGVVCVARVGTDVASMLDKQGSLL